MERDMEWCGIFVRSVPRTLYLLLTKIKAIRKTVIHCYTVYVLRIIMLNFIIFSFNLPFIVTSATTGARSNWSRASALSFTHLRLHRANSLKWSTMLTAFTLDVLKTVDCIRPWYPPPPRTTQVRTRSFKHRDSCWPRPPGSPCKRSDIIRHSVLTACTPS